MRPISFRAIRTAFVTSVVGCCRSATEATEAVLSDALRKLHTTMIDTREGYVAAKRDADGWPLESLFCGGRRPSHQPRLSRTVLQRSGRAAQLLAESRGETLRVASAGMPGYPGRGMDPEMATQLRARGGEPNGHVSRALTHEILGGSDLVLTFEFEQRLRIIDEWPDQAVKVFGVRQFARGLR